MLWNTNVKRRLIPRTWHSIRRLSLLTAVAATLLGALVPSADADNQQSISLAVGHGRLVELDQATSQVYLADPSVADIQQITPNRLYLYGRRTGTTNLIAVNGQHHANASISIAVTQADANAANRQRDADAQQDSLKLKAVGRQLEITGSSDSVGSELDTTQAARSQVDSDDQVSNQSTYSGANQINIRVRFAELSRDELRQYGINWNGQISNGSFNFGILGTSNASIPLSRMGGTRIDGLLQALESNNVVKILAEPNITAVSGHTARFLAGGEVPIPIPVNDNLVGIQYKKYGVSLVTTPTLLPNNRISMNVNPEVSSLVDGGNVKYGNVTVPQLVERSADTTVEVGNGQTFAIGGLFQRNDSTDVDGLPILSHIPILGPLFSSKRFQSHQTELVILITPYLVKPSSETPRTPLDKAQVSQQPRISQPPIKENHDFGFDMH
ncbi:Type 3 secretion system secretin [Carnimonas sp. LMG 33810]